MTEYSEVWRAEAIELLKPVMVLENTIGLLWLFTAALLVLMMQAGFLLLEAGSVRQRNIQDISQKNILALIVSGAFFWLVGANITFGQDLYDGWFGWGGLELHNNETRLQLFFQMAFCATAITIISGAVAERVTFRGYILISILMSVLIYPLFAHLAWGGLLISGNQAFLADLGFLDFAGGAVVHVVGAAAALGIVLVIGPRAGRFNEDGSVRNMGKQSSVYTLVGTVILLIGWFGFNAGSVSPMSSAFSLVVLNTLLGAIFGGAAAVIFSICRSGRIYKSTTVVGILGGLVAVTSGVGYYGFEAAIFIGFAGGLVARFSSTILLYKFKVDDPVNAIAVHGFAGITGTIMTGIFADSLFFDGSRIELVAIQIIGTFIAAFWAMSIAYIFTSILTRFMSISISKDEDYLGLDIVEYDDELTSQDIEVLKKMVRENGSVGSDLGPQLEVDNHSLEVVNMALKTFDTVQKEKEDAQKEVQYLAYFDPLTNLLNRFSFNSELKDMLARCDTSKHSVVLLCLDLDGFKAINDTYGHETGDNVLKIVGDRLRGATRTLEVILGRNGGDEFSIAIKLSNSEFATHIGEICSRILRSISMPLRKDDSSLKVGISIGASFYPAQAKSDTKMFRYADLALYEAKSQGKQRWVQFEHKLEERAKRRLRLEKDMIVALDKGEFYLEYQPQVDIKSNRITGVEALIRWKHPEMGNITPVDFIFIAEENGFINQLGEWVFRKACITAQALPRVGGKPVLMSVNVSAAQLSSPLFFEKCKKIVTELKLEPGQIEIEFTETMLVKNDRQIISILRKFREFGVRVAIDDFGTGYSSLSYLQKLPLDRLKVDRSFVQNLETSESDRSIAQTIVQLGKNLNLDVIAEGVETERQLKMLKHMGCDAYQGYLKSKPLSLQKLAEMFAGQLSAIGAKKRAQKLQHSHKQSEVA